VLYSFITALDEAHIVVDGFDEITSDKQKTALLRELHKLPARTLIFSRPLDLHLRHLPSATIFSIEASDQDIENFVVSSLLDHRSLQGSVPGPQNALVREIATRVRERCCGM